MQDRYNHSIDGQEVNESDINLIATEAALADDQVFSELLRMSPSGDGLTAGSRGVLMASQTAIAGRGQAALLVPSLSADARVYVAAFRAFVMVPAAQASDAYKNLRSALCVTSGAAGSGFAQSLQFAAATNNRWDLVYVRLDVDVDGPAVSRFVKTGTTPATLTGVAVTKRTVATLVVLQGTEATTPSLPAVPADSGSSYYIPIAYVFLPAGHTLTTSIKPYNIEEVSAPQNIDSATGAASLAVANGSWQTTGFAVTGETWFPSSGRPQAYLPPTMGGKQELFFALIEGSGSFSVPLGGTRVIDNSVDWRRRVFKVTAVTAGITPQFPWNPGGSAFQMFSGGLQNYRVVSASFNDGAGVSTTGKAYLVSLTSGTTPATVAAGAQVDIYVDLSDGSLKCDVGATSPASRIIIWLEATGQFNNAF